MPLFRRANRVNEQSAPAASTPSKIDQSLPDEAWLTASEQEYERTWRSHIGSPETFSAAGRIHYDQQNFGVALMFFGKAIDLLQTMYVFGQMASRQPSPRDLTITSGFVSSLGATIALHPSAPVDESVRSATGMLRSICSACKRAGVPADLYLNALQDIGKETPNVRIDDIYW